MSKIQVVAHSAGTTVETLRSTARGPCDLLEVDVHQTADGVLVLADTPAYRRTTPPTPWPEVEYRRPSDSVDSPIDHHATLTDALSVATDFDLGLMIDVKRGPHYYPGIERELCRILDVSPTPARVIVLSYDHSWIRTLNTSLESTTLDVETGLLFVAHLHDLEGTIRDTGVDLIETQPRFVTEQVQRTLEATDTELIGWATESRRLLEEQLDKGVEYLKSDDVELAKQLVNSYTDG